MMSERKKEFVLCTDRHKFTFFFSLASPANKEGWNGTEKVKGKREEDKVERTRLGKRKDK